MMRKNKVIYIGNFEFPDGNAAGNRVYSNAKLFKEIGYDVIIIGSSKSIIGKQIPLKNTKKIYDGFSYYSLPYPMKNVEWLTYKKAFNSITSLLNEEGIIDDIDIIIYYGSPRLTLFNKLIIDFCNDKKIKILSDCVDWLTVKTNNFLFDIVKWIDNTYQKTIINKKTDGIIVISSYLSDYYKKYNCKTTIIPPLTTSINSKLDNKSGKIKVITYAGIPFRKGEEVKDPSKLKDRIDKIIKLMYQSKINGCLFILNIYGFTKEEYLFVLPSQRKYVEFLGDNVRFFGLISNKEVLNNLMQSDYTILLRDINRDTSAGFPSKVSESISCGVPVITTRTSDLDHYIIDGLNGFFLSLDDEKENEKKIQDILGLSNTEIDKMKKYCINNNPFHYERYKKSLEEFIFSL